MQIKRAFREIANEEIHGQPCVTDGQTSACADTVDKFQEVNDQLCWSAWLHHPKSRAKVRKRAFEAKVADYSYNAKKVSSKRGGFNDGGIGYYPHIIVRSPEQLLSLVRKIY